MVFGLWVAVYAADMLTLVKERSQIEFVGTKPSGSHRGGFTRFTADGAADWGDLSKSSFKIDIDATSLWSDNNGLTNHLKNSDFFDVPRYPNITFETTRIELASAKEAVVTGKLTMLGQGRGGCHPLQHRSDRRQPSGEIRVQDRPHPVGHD